MIFQFITKDLESNKEKLREGFKIIPSEETDITKCFENSSLASFIIYVYEFTQANYGDSNVIEISRFFLEHDFHIQLIRLNEYFSQVLNTLKEEVFETDADQRKTIVFAFSQCITNFLILYSRDFSLKYFENGGLKYLIELVDNEIFLYNFSTVFDNLMLNLSSLSIKCHHIKALWYEMNTVNVLLKIAKRKEKYHKEAYGVVLRIIDDNDLNKLTEMQEVIISPFIGPLSRGAKLILETGNHLKRVKMQFYDDDEKTSQHYDVFCVPDAENKNNVFALTSIMLTIYRLSVNDKIKYDLYVKYNVKEPLRTILFKGSLIEQKFALQILAQLCFDAQVLDLVLKDSELVSFIESVAKDAKSIKATIGFCKEILWSISMKNNSEKAKSEVVSSQRNQIMISYNSGSRDLCLKIKQELEKVGFKIWIDVNEIHGSSLDSMANAIDSSEVILMCVTEGYRQSVNCQAEAQYAFKHKKTIIPLIFEKGYESVGGWLGMIMGDRIYISFIKYAFDDALSKLLNQLEHFKPSIHHPVVEPSIPKLIEPPPNKHNEISKWNEEQVEKWFQQNGNTVIYEYIKPCNGELLNQLFRMRNDAPEFFFQFISVKNKVEGRDILLFTNNLEKLFGKIQ